MMLASTHLVHLKYLNFDVSCCGVSVSNVEVGRAKSGSSSRFKNGGVPSEGSRGSKDL